LIFLVVVISGDRYRFSADSEQLKEDWMKVLQDASRISVKSVACCVSAKLYLLLINKLSLHVRLTPLLTVHIVWSNFILCS